VGYQSLCANTTGQYNTALGNEALRSNTAGSMTGVGAYALYANTSGV
jgi:trimeric autotransporter adhesin